MNEIDYREVESALAETLRVFLESKQKLTTYERTCRDALVAILGDVVKRRTQKKTVSESVLNEG